MVPTDRTPESAAEAGQQLSKTGRADLDSRARSHLANERTFLAWLRTGLALIVVGIGAAQFLELDRDLIPGVRSVSDFAAMLILVGTLTVIVGRARYMQSREADRAGAVPPGGALHHGGHRAHRRHRRALDRVGLSHGALVAARLPSLVARATCARAGATHPQARPARKSRRGSGSESRGPG